MPSHIRDKTLDLLRKRPGQRFHVRELARLLEVDPGNLSRTLKLLEVEDLLKKTQEGRQVYYSLSARTKELGFNPEAVRKELKNLEKELIKFTQDLIRIPSVSGENPEEKIAEFIHSTAGSFGLESRLVFKDRFRPNVVIETDPRKKENFLLIGHMDTIGIGEISQWKYYPFSAHIAGGRMYGRGTSDMKAGIACELFTLRLIKELDLNIPFNVKLLLVSNEEGGATSAPIFEQGLEYLIDEGHVEGEAAIYGYGGSYNIGIGHRGVLRVRIKTFGEGVHTGSVKWQKKEKGVNAVTGMAEILLALEGLKLPQVEHEDFPGKNNVITPGTMILHGGSAVSTVPDYAESVVDVRFLPGVNMDTIYHKIKEAAERVIIKRGGLKVSLEKFVEIPAICISRTEKIVETLSHSCEDVYGKPPSARGTGPANESFMLIRKGIPTVTFGPIGGGPHAANEFVNIDSLAKTVEVYIRTIARMAA